MELNRLPALCLLLLAFSGTPAYPQEFQVQWSSWQVLGPIAHAKGSRDIKKPYPVEKSLKHQEPNGAGPDLRISYKNLNHRPIGWKDIRTGTANPLQHSWDRMDFRQVFGDWGGPLDKQVVYLYRYADTPTPIDLEFLAGSDDGLRLWWNGKLRIDANEARGLNLHDHRLTLSLETGRNHLFIKVSQGNGDWAFHMSPATQRSQARPEWTPKVNQAIEEGVQFILGTQHLDGSWGYLGREYAGGNTALSLYTLLRCGVSVNHPAIRQGFAYLKAHPPDRTYSASCLLLALAASEEEQFRPWAKDLARQLHSYQARSGLWLYPDTRPADLSNTLFAAMALRAAQNFGVASPRSFWQKVLKASLNSQEPERPLGDGQEEKTGAGFFYHPSRPASGTMTTAGLSLLGIAREMLGDKLVGARLRQVNKAQDLALAWLAHHLTFQTNPAEPGGKWHYYFIYGIERVGSLLQLDTLGEIDWYWTGVEYLLEHQTERGSWRGHDTEAHEEIDTCMALLFLKRASVAKVVTGDTVATSIRAYGKYDPQTTATLRASGDQPLSVWIAGFGSQELQEFSSSRSGERHLPVKQVRYSATSMDFPHLESLTKTVRGSEASEDFRCPVQFDFPENGSWEITAQITLAPDNEGQNPAAPILHATPLTVVIQSVLPEAVLAYAEDSQRNLLRDLEVRVSASTRLSNAEAEHFLTDGLSGTKWLAQPDDRQPWLQIRLKKSVSVRRILLTPAHNKLLDGRKARPRRVQIFLNDQQKEALEFEIPETPRRKAILELSESQKIQSLRLNILDCTDGILGRDPVGFAEIELQ